MNNKNKDNVFTDYLEMIKKSWTYDRMTQEEKDKIHYILLDYRTTENIKGTYQQRWQALNALYHAFLIGIGYDNFDWRGGKNENVR